MAEEKQQLEVQTITIADAQTHLTDLVNRVSRKEARVLVEESGVPFAAIVSAEDLKRLGRLDQQESERFRVLEAMRTPFRDVPPEEIERETDRIVAEIREENRQRRQKSAIGR